MTTRVLNPFSFGLPLTQTGMGTWMILLCPSLSTSYYGVSVDKKGNYAPLEGSMIGHLLSLRKMRISLLVKRLCPLYVVVKAYASYEFMPYCSSS